MFFKSVRNSLPQEQMQTKPRDNAHERRERHSARGRVRTMRYWLGTR